MDLADIETMWHDGAYRNVTEFKAVSYAASSAAIWLAYYQETNQPVFALLSFVDNTFTPTSQLVLIKLTSSGTPVAQRIL